MCSPAARAWHSSTAITASPPPPTWRRSSVTRSAGMGRSACGRWKPTAPPSKTFTSRPRPSRPPSEESLAPLRGCGRFVADEEGEIMRQLPGIDHRRIDIEDRLEGVAPFLGIVDRVRVEAPGEDEGEGPVE